MAFKNNLFWYYHLLFNAKLIKKSNLFFEENYRSFLGKRVFIVCNGPSLNMKDLDKIQNEYSIASNKIYLAFESTKWRPSFFTISDRILWLKIRHEVYNYSINPILTSNLIGMDNDNSILVRNFGYFSKHSNGFSSNMSHGIFGARTVTYQNLQLAVHLGFKEIYLVGCDHFYNEKKPNISTIVEHKNSQNHFHKDYRLDGEKVNYAPIEAMEAGYKYARNFLDNHNIKIFNASRKTKLKEFEQINFDTLF